MKPAQHYPIPYPYPRTETSPAELTVICSCGEWEFFTQESAGGGLEAWGADFEAHAQEESYE